MRSALLRLALHYTEDEDEAEDVVQEVLLKLWFLRERLETYRSIDALGGGHHQASLSEPETGKAFGQGTVGRRNDHHRGG